MRPSQDSPIMMRDQAESRNMIANAIDDDLNDIMNIITNFEHCLMTYVSCGSSDLDIKRLVDDELTHNIISKFNEAKGVKDETKDEVAPKVDLVSELSNIGQTIQDLQNINGDLMHDHYISSRANKQIWGIAQCIEQLNY